MRIRLHKQARELFSEEEWSTIHEAFEFYVKENDLESYNQRVYVKFPASLPSDRVYLGIGFDVTRGYCLTEFVYENGKLKPDRFTIQISRASSMNKILEAIFHEMTHVAQEIRGDFEKLRDGSERFKGVHYSVDILSKPTYNQYRNFPWEVEAREVSYAMLKKWHTKHEPESFWTKLTKLWR